ncbi:MAG: hypothetical protein U9R25_11420 [Chloroflexota bacterium]|nr:hypothetical protein [Chloroflexota bacterium]
MMKRTTILSLMLVAMLALAACGAGGPEESSGETTSAAAPAPAANVESDKVRLNEDHADALPVSLQLALGSVELGDGDLAIDESVAGEILPLWQAYQGLSTSDSAAKAELSAVLNQIQDTMGPEQIEAIVAMALTSEDVTAFTEERGGAFGRGGFGGGEGAEGGLPGGGPGGGGLPGGRPGGGDFFGQSPEARQTAIAERFGSGVDPMVAFGERMLINTLIRELQVKTGELDEADLQVAPDRFGPARFMDIISEASGIALEALQEQTTEGATLAEIISANGGDMAAAEAALTEFFGQSGNMEPEVIEQRVSDLLYGTEGTGSP